MNGFTNMLMTEIYLGNTNYLLPLALEPGDPPLPPQDLPIVSSDVEVYFWGGPPMPMAPALVTSSTEALKTAMMMIISDNPVFGRHTM